MKKELKQKLYERPDLIGEYNLETEGESNCCGAPVITDIEMCSQCYEYCEQRNAMCKFCGEEFPEWDEDGYCSDNCWKGYASETFYDD